MYLRYMTAHVRVNASITCYAGYFAVHLLHKYTILPHYRDEMRSANLALISGRQMHRINACIFLVAITKTPSEGFPPEGE